MFDDVPPEHEYHNLGNDCYRLGHYEKAAAYYTKALELNTRMVETYFNRALAYARLGRYDAALADASRALKENAGLYDAYYLRGRIWELHLNDRAAAADYQKALELNPSFEAAAEQLGLITSRGGVYRELRELRDQIDVEPTNGYLRYQFGQRLSVIGHNDEALRALEQARGCGFAMADLWVELGQVYAASGRAIQAVAAFRQAVRVDPTNVATYAHLGQLLSDAGRFGEAVTAFQQALSMPNEDTASLYCGLGTALNGLGRWGEAREAFQQALELRADIPEGVLGLASVAWRQGDYDGARRSCQRVLDGSPDHLSARVLAVVIAFSRADHLAASEMIRRVYQSHSDDVRVAYVLWAIAAHVTRSSGQAEGSQTTARFWQVHDHDIKSARRLVREKVRSRRELIAVQRGLPARLVETCPLAEDVAESLRRRLVGSPRTVLETLYDELEEPGIVPMAPRLRRVSDIARSHDEAWLVDLCSAYATILSGTPEAPRTGLVLAVLGRLTALGTAHADVMLDLYRLSVDGCAVGTIEEMLLLAPRIRRVARLTSASGSIVPGVGTALTGLGAWLDRVGSTAHGAASSDEWTAISESGLELRRCLAEQVAPPELWVLSSMLTTFGMISRQHVPTV